jgi:hypothetical protein
MLALRKQYEAALDASRQLPEQERAATYGGKNEKLDAMLDALVKTNLTSSDLRRLATTCSILPTDGNHWDDFTRHVFSYMLQSLLDSGDRDAVLNALSTRCPDFVWDFDYIEFYIPYRGGKLQHPILILEEAYFKCRDPDVRHHIALAFRRAFTSSGIRGDRDPEFVRNATKWYREDCGHLRLNRRHRPRSKTFPHEENDPMFRSLLDFGRLPPLFVEIGKQ